MHTVKIADAGERLIVSGATRDAVEHAMAELINRGAHVLDNPAQVGSRWICAVTHPTNNTEACTIEQAGLQFIVTGPSLHAVELALDDLRKKHGAQPLNPPEKTERGEWIVICDSGRNDKLIHRW